MLIRVFDTESTGLPTDDDPHALVEVGWCDIINGEVGEPRAMLLNPGRPIPPDAMAIHHITDDDVADAPPPSAGCAALMEGAPDVFVAHNADHDRKFFGGGGVPFVCSYKVALRFWPDAERHTNQYLRYYLDLPVDRAKAEPPHRAGPDAYVTAHLVVRILGEADARGVSIDDMVRWSRGPALLPRINFGKHKGAKWEDVPADYLEWVVFKSDLDRDAKANARHWLKQRGAL